MIAVLMLLAVQGAEPAPTPVPAPSDKPPVVELAPTAPPPPVTPPSDSAPSPDTNPDKKSEKPTPVAPVGPPKADRRPHDEPYGMAPLNTALVQMAGGTGACCVGACLALPFGLGLGFIPVVGTYVAGVVSDGIEGVAIGGTEAALGDLFGTERAPAAWPVVTSFGFLLAGSAGTIGVQLALKAQGIATPAPTSTPAQLQAYLSRTAGYSAAEVGISCASTLGAIAVPAAIYAMTAVDKKPGDAGQGFPGIFEPASPSPVTSKTVTVAMASGPMAF